MKSFIHIILVLILVLSCNNNEQEINIINNNDNLEFRNNNRREKGLLRIIEKGSDEFEKLKSYINNLENLKAVEDIHTYPFYTITGKDLKILINVNSIDIEYLNSKNIHVKLSKEITSEEFLDFNYLSHSHDQITDFGNLYGTGNLKTAKYIECGLEPQEIKYQYKVGQWKFWNLNRKLIAEGKFEIDSASAMGRGGCDFMVKMSRIKPDKWKFYNENGEETKGTKGTIEQIYNIENAE